MKKKVLAVLLGMTMLVMAACGGQKEVVFGISQAASDLLDSGAFTDTLTKCDNDKVATLYSVDADTLAEYEVYIGTGATAEEIAIFRVKDSKDLDAVKTACETRIEDQKKACENYLPDEMPKLNSPVIRTAGNYVVMVISADNSKAESALDKYIK